MLPQAQAILTEILRPHSYDHFFEEIVGRQPLALLGDEIADRAMILGSDPKRVILEAFEKHASELTCHALAPKVPPPSARAVADASAFHALIREYHDLGYTVRIPEVIDLSPELRRLTRALEVILEIPVGAVIFWSAAGATAPIHHDEVDVFAIQLVGKKRWFVSKDPPKLPNKWKAAGEPPPSLDRYSTIDVVPGNVLYLPRGTAHTVQSATESIHISIGFVPVTVREAIMATLDHLSDLDKPLRAGVTNRADELAKGEGSEYVSARVKRGLEKLIARCQSDTFIQCAMERRRSRMIADLPKLSPSVAKTATNLNSRVRHNPVGVAHIIKTPDTIDFSQPGEQIFIHLGAEESLRFIVKTPEFRVADIPGRIDDEVRMALVNRLLGSGFLETVDGS